MALIPRLMSGSSAKRPEPTGINAVLRVQKNSTGQPCLMVGLAEHRWRRDHEGAHEVLHLEPVGTEDPRALLLLYRFVLRG